MHIAVTSQNYRTVTPHAGRTRRFLVFEAVAGSRPVEVDRIDLPIEFTMHQWRGGEKHPLDAVDVVIAGSFGDHFAQRLARRGVLAVVSQQSDPAVAINDFLAASNATALVSEAKARRSIGHDEAHDDPDDGHRHGHDGCGCHEAETPQ